MLQIEVIMTKDSNHIVTSVSINNELATRLFPPLYKNSNQFPQSLIMFYIYNRYGALTRTFKSLKKLVSLICVMACIILCINHHYSSRQAVAQNNTSLMSQIFLAIINKSLRSNVQSLLYLHYQILTSNAIVIFKRGQQFVKHKMTTIWVSCHSNLPVSKLYHFQLISYHINKKQYSMVSFSIL